MACLRKDWIGRDEGTFAGSAIKTLGEISFAICEKNLREK